MKEIMIYSKYCLPCHFEKEFEAVSRWAIAKNIKIKIKRTAYRPEQHIEAVDLWGDADYTAFIVDLDGKVVSMADFYQKVRNKRFDCGKSKEVKDDVRELPKEKSDSKNKRVVSDKKTVAKNKKREKAK